MTMVSIRQYQSEGLITTLQEGASLHLDRNVQLRVTMTPPPPRSRLCEIVLSIMEPEQYHSTLTCQTSSVVLSFIPDPSRPRGAPHLHVSKWSRITVLRCSPDKKTDATTRHTDLRVLPHPEMVRQLCTSPM